MKAFKFLLIYLISANCTTKENTFSTSSNYTENRKDQFHSFIAAFPDINLPIHTSTYQPDNSINLDTSITKDFVPSIYNTTQTITPIGKFIHNDYFYIIWKEQSSVDEVWQLATYFPSTDPLDQVEIKRSGKVKLESVLNPDLSLTMDLNNKTFRIHFGDGRSVFPEEYTVEELNYMGLKDPGENITPIQFAKGYTYSLIQTSMLPASADYYSFYAKKGQQCEIRLVANNSNLYLSLHSKDSTILPHGIDSFWEGKLPVTGEYSINIGLMRSEARVRKTKVDYSLLVHIK